MTAKPMGAPLRAGLPVRRWIAAAVSAGMLLAGPALAADLPAPVPPVKAVEPQAATSDWKYQLTVYAWATAITGDVGVRTLPSVPVDVSIGDILGALDGAVMGSMFASNGQWLILADVIFAKYSQSASVDRLGGAPLDLGMTQALVSGAIGYMLPTGRTDFDFAVTGGVRYLHMKADETLTLGGPPVTLSGSQTKWWIDPTVGFFAHWELNKKWYVNAIADIGGFGVGSKLSSTGYAGLGYMWTESISTALGYRYLYEDYEESGPGAGSFRYNTTTHGPTLAVAWRF